MRTPLGVLVFVGCSLLALGTASPAAAQAVPKADISGGYQVLGFTGDVDETFVKGWYVDLAGNITPTFGVVFQAGGVYKSVSESATFGGVSATADADLSFHQFMGGIRINARPNPTVTPFAEVLAGGIRGSADVSGSVTGGGETFFASSDAFSSTNAALELGGGVDLRLTDRVGVRGGADYVRVFDEEGGVNGFRFIIGAVFPF